MTSLPPELQREIVEIAVRANHPDAAVKLNLSLAAHCFHFWVDQVFYESVTIEYSAGKFVHLLDLNADKFLRLVDLKPAGFFAGTVKALSVPVLTNDRMDRILAACTGARILTFVPYDLRLRLFDIPALDRLPPLRRLIMPLKLVLISLLATAKSTSITHLDLRPPFLNEDNGGLSTNVLRYFPRLTNLAVNLLDPVAARAVCASCPDLRVLVITPTTVLEEYSFDPRIVFIEGEIWQRDAAHIGLPDFWTRAESIVDERRALLGAAIQSS